jgi:hypothetical protein
VEAPASSAQNTARTAHGQPVRPHCLVL